MRTPKVSRSSGRPLSIFIARWRSIRATRRPAHPSGNPRVRSITQRVRPEGAKSPKGRESFITEESEPANWMNRVAHDTLGRRSQAGHEVFALRLARRSLHSGHQIKDRL